LRSQNDGNSPLHVAAMAGSVECLRLFLAHAADFEVTNKVTENAACNDDVWLCHR
jgi:ankyrin repeat protein